MLIMSRLNSTREMQGRKITGDLLANYMNISFDMQFFFSRHAKFYENNEKNYGHLQAIYILYVEMQHARILCRKLAYISCKFKEMNFNLHVGIIK